jgi:hypothetical protein
MPMKVGNMERTTIYARDTWRHYESILKLQESTGRKLGVTLLPTYVLNDEDEHYHYRIEGII